MLLLHWLAMAGLPEYLRCHVAWSTAGCGENVKLLLVHDAREPKISNQQIGVVLWCSEQQVLWLQISVHNSVVMKICDCRQRSPNQIAGVGFVVISFATDAVKELASKRQISD
jgi:hypothetical protein